MAKKFLIVCGGLLILVFVILVFPRNVPSENEANLQSNYVTINLPAVDVAGNGQIAKLTVRSESGNGKILTNINQISFWIDTQDSIRTAELVAKNITRKGLSNIDLVYNIETNAPVIEGPSGGAALAIATVALLENKTLNQSVMITGTINSDGTIGQVGSVLEKAKVAKYTGATLFLVPVGEGYENNFLPEKTCTQYGSVTFCSTKYKTQTIDISKEVGIQVVEVANVNDALKYFVS